MGNFWISAGDECLYTININPGVIEIFLYKKRKKKKMQPDGAEGKHQYLLDISVGDQECHG